MNDKPRKVTDNPSEGVFQLQDFPYTTYETWRTAYKKAASEANEGLKIQKADNGKEWSLIDLMDDAPLRSAYAHHLDPVPLGNNFGKTFSIDEMQFADGTKTRDFSPPDSTRKSKPLFGIKHPIAKAVFYLVFVLLSGGLGLIAVVFAMAGDYYLSRRKRKAP